MHAMDIDRPQNSASGTIAVSAGNHGWLAIGTGSGVRVDQASRNFRSGAESRMETAGSECEACKEGIAPQTALSRLHAR